MYIFLSGLGLLVIVGLHQLLESRKVSETGQSCGPGRDGSHLCAVVRYLPPGLHLVLFFFLLCSLTEEASGSQGGDGNDQPQRCGPELDPPGDAQPDQYVHASDQESPNLRPLTPAPAHLFLSAPCWAPLLLAPSPFCSS